MQRTGGSRIGRNRVKEKLAAKMNKALLGIEAPPIMEFKRRAAGTRPSGGEVFDFSQAVPAFATFGKIREYLRDSLNDPGTSFYTDVPGLEELRAKVALSHPLKNSLSPDSVLITAGANHAMFTAFLLFFQGGDRVALLEPFYFNYEMGLKMLGISPVPMIVSDRRGFRPVAEEIIAELERSKAQGLVLISPNNPTGACYESAQILRLLEWTSQRGIEVILDETYMHFDPGHLNMPDIGRFLGKGLSIVGSFSKTYSLTGYRVGYLMTGARQMDEALKIQDTLVICAPRLAQMAALHGLQYCQEDVEREKLRMAGLAKQLQESASRLKCFSLASVGAFFAYLRHPFPLKTGSHEECCQSALRLYQETGILGLPGTIFGAKQAQFIRFAFCNSDEKALTSAMARLHEFDQRLRSERPE